MAGGDRVLCSWARRCKARFGLGELYDDLDLTVGLQRCAAPNQRQEARFHALAVKIARGSEQETVPYRSPAQGSDPGVEDELGQLGAETTQDAVPHRGGVAHLLC